MTSAGFEPTIPAEEWPQTHALESAALWIIFRPIFYAKQIKVECLIIFCIDRIYHHISKCANVFILCKILA